MKVLQGSFPMTRIEGKTYLGLFDRDSSRAFANMELSRCCFESCGLSITRSPALRSTVNNVTLVGCEQRRCLIESAIFDTVTVDGLKTNGLLQVWAAAFRHVSLRGKIGRIMLSSALAPGVDGLAPEASQSAFDRANAEFYASTDWALDLSEAEFEECTIRGLPGHLIRRDSATQVLITREAALTGSWRKIDLSGTHWSTTLEVFLASQASDIVLVAPKRHTKFKSLVRGLQKLRDCGVAEPD